MISRLQAKEKLSSEPFQDRCIPALIRFDHDSALGPDAGYRIMPSCHPSTRTLLSIGGVGFSNMRRTREVRISERVNGG